jgi:hypothetical protein
MSTVNGKRVLKEEHEGFNCDNELRKGQNNTVL